MKALDTNPGPLDRLAEGLNSITDNVRSWTPEYTASFAQSLIVTDLQEAREQFLGENRKLRKALAALIDGARHARDRSTAVGMADMARLEVLGSVCAAADEAAKLLERYGKEGGSS